MTFFTFYTLFSLQEKIKLCENHLLIYCIYKWPHLAVPTPPWEGKDGNRYMVGKREGGRRWWVQWAKIWEKGERGPEKVGVRWGEWSRREWEKKRGKWGRYAGMRKIPRNEEDAQEWGRCAGMRKMRRNEEDTQEWGRYAGTRKRRGMKKSRENQREEEMRKKIMNEWGREEERIKKRRTINEKRIRKGMKMWGGGGGLRTIKTIKLRYV